MPTLFDFTLADIRGAIAGSAVTLFLAGMAWLWQKGLRYKRLALARSIWKPFLRDEARTVIVLTTKSSTRPSGTPKVSLSEVQAFSQIRNTLSALGGVAELEERADIHLGMIPHNHIISIGGPKSNNVTKEIMAAAVGKYPGLPIKYSEADECFWHGGDKLVSKLNDKNMLTQDYALIVRVYGLAGGGAQSCLVAFGLRGHGTWAAVQAMTLNNKVMKNIHAAAGAKDFSILLSCAFDGNNLIETKVVSAGALII